MTEGLEVPYEKFSAHIQEETEKARGQLSAWIDDPSVTTVGCVDKLTKKGHVNPPGSGMFLLNEGHLSRFLQTRSGLTGTIFIHESCGYMQVIMGLKTLKQHRQALSIFNKQLGVLQKQFGTNFRVVREIIGSARPYMKG